MSEELDNTMCGPCYWLAEKGKAGVDVRNLYEVCIVVQLQSVVGYVVILHQYKQG